MKIPFKKEDIFSTVLVCVGAFCFPIGFFLLAKKRDRTPPMLLTAIFLVILSIVVGAFFYLIYPDTKGWYNVFLIGGAHTATFLLSRGTLFERVKKWQMSLFFYLTAIFSTFTLCGLYIVRLKLLGMNFSFFAPAIFVAGSFLWAWLVVYANKNYPSETVHGET